jgi:hypothetical protein
MVNVGCGSDTRAYQRISAERRRQVWNTNWKLFKRRAHGQAVATLDCGTVHRSKRRALAGLENWLGDVVENPGLDRRVSVTSMKNLRRLQFLAVLIPRHHLCTITKFAGP